MGDQAAGSDGRVKSITAYARAGHPIGIDRLFRYLAARTIPQRRGAIISPRAAPDSGKERYAVRGIRAQDRPGPRRETYLPGP